MLHAVTTGAYYPPVDTTWKILTTGASKLTAGALCSGDRRVHVRFFGNKKVLGQFVGYVSQGVIEYVKIENGFRYGSANQGPPCNIMLTSS